MAADPTPSAPSRAMADPTRPSRGYEIGPEDLAEFAALDPEARRGYVETPGGLAVVWTMDGASTEGSYAALKPCGWSIKTFTLAAQPGRAQPMRSLRSPVFTGLLNKCFQPRRIGFEFPSPRDHPFEIGCHLGAHLIDR